MTTPVNPADGVDRLIKVPTGITGFDEITEGGLPRGRTTVVCGRAGCGKSLFAAEFLLRGARDMGEPGVLISFEETPEEIAVNLASLGHDVQSLTAQGLLRTDFIRVERSEILESGPYDLEGLFVRIGLAVDAIGATRVVLDTLEALFAGLSDSAILRGELRRLFRWLKDRGLTAVVTAESGEGRLTRHGIEEYVSDCVLVLDHQTVDRIATRRLQVVKYRGTGHGTNSYPFTIDDDGIRVVPSTSMGLEHAVTDERVSTGVPALDTLLGGAGVHRGSTVLVSGQAGTGKSSLGMSFALAAADRGERCLYLAFEESPDQIMRNMRSLGMDVRAARESGHLIIQSARPTSAGLENHLGHVVALIERHAPSTVVLDPLTSLEVAGSAGDVRMTLMRLLDVLKSRGITTLMTSLVSGVDAEDGQESGVSSLVDTWLLLRNLEEQGERNRTLYVLKSRGTAHSNQIREFVLTDDGITLLPVQIIDNRVMTGSARLAAQAAAAADLEVMQVERDLADQAIATRQAVVAARIRALEAELQVETDRVRRELDRRELELARLHRVDARRGEPSPETS